MGNKIKTEKPTFTGSDRFKYTANVSAMIFFAFSLLFMVNYLASRHYKRIDLTTYKKNSLSLKTLKLLDGLSLPLQITTVSVSSQQSFEIYRNQIITDLVDEFKSQSDLIEVVHCDYHRNHEQMTKLLHKLKEYKYQGEANELVFSIVLQTPDKYKVLPYEKFFDSKNSAARPEFKGEGALSDAIYELISNKVKRILSVQGHGELDIQSNNSDGLSLLKQRIQRENIKLEIGEILNFSPLIQHTELVFIAAPQKPFREEELDELALFLDSGGKLIVFFDEWEDSNLNEILGKRGIYARNDQARLPRRFFPTQLTIRRWYSPHPINEPFGQFSGLSAFFNGSCTLSLRENEKEYHVQSIAESSAETLGILNSSRNNPTKNHFQRTGPFPVAAISEAKPMKIVVFGDADFIKNGQKAKGTNSLGIRDGVNMDFVLNSINWCLDEESRLGIGARQVDLRTIQLDLETSQKIGFLLCIMIPLVFVTLYWIVFDWIKTNALQNFLDVLEDVIRQPVVFFSTSISEFTLVKAILFQLKVTILLGIIFYSFASHFAFPYILGSKDASSLKPITEKITAWEEQIYLNVALNIAEVPEEQQKKNLKFNIRTTFLVRFFQYILIYLYVSAALFLLSLATGILGWLILSLLLQVIDPFAAESRKSKFLLAGTLSFMSLSTIHWLCPVFGLYTFYLLFRGIQKGYQLATARTCLLLLLLIGLQIAGVAFFCCR